jgi:hypothetical protein
MTVGPKSIEATLARKQASELWQLIHGQVGSIFPFWIACIEHFSSLTGLDIEKKSSYLKTAKGAFALMDDWRFERTKFVKARRNEIDSAISFVRNAALRHPIASLRAAASARNAAAALRLTLNVSCNGYRDDQLPELLSTVIFDIAAVRVQFPFDFGTLACFHPGYAADTQGHDPFLLMLEKAANKTGRTKELFELFTQVEHIYSSLENPLEISSTSWFTAIDDSNAHLHYAAQNAFHSR